MGATHLELICARHSPTWTENDIEDRTKDLVEKAIKIFEL
jgi:hypothetical protein